MDTGVSPSGDLVNVRCGSYLLASTCKLRFYARRTKDGDGRPEREVSLFFEAPRASPRLRPKGR